MAQSGASWSSISQRAGGTLQSFSTDYLASLATAGADKIHRNSSYASGYLTNWISPFVLLAAICLVFDVSLFFFFLH